jgi:hypothetical protein
MKPRTLMVPILMILLAAITLLPGPTQATTGCYDNDHLTCPANYLAFGICGETGQPAYLFWDTAHSIHISRPSN